MGVQEVADFLKGRPKGEKLSSKQIAQLMRVSRGRVSHALSILVHKRKEVVKEFSHNFGYKKWVPVYYYLKKKRKF